jgi:hypothetical protein
MKISNLRLILMLWGFALALAATVIFLMVLRGPATAL